MLHGAAAAQPAVLVLGDSISAAWGIDAGQGWVALLRERLADTHPDYGVVNASVSGDTTRTGLNRLSAALEEHQPSVVIVELGGNDGLRGLSFDEIENNLTGIIRLSQRHGAKVLLTGIRLPPNYGPAYNTRFAALFERVAEEMGVPLVPRLLDDVAEHAVLMQSDGIHPNGSAQRRILENVWPRLQPLL